MAPYSLEIWDFVHKRWLFVSYSTSAELLWNALGNDTWGYRLINTTTKEVLFKDVKGIFGLED